MCCIMGDISLAVYFSIFAGISSGPGALLEFRASSCFIPFSRICRVLIEGNGDGPFVGIGSCSFVKTCEVVIEIDCFVLVSCIQFVINF